MDAIVKEWHLRLPLLAGHRIVSIYFGGGTPTRLDLEDLKTLLGLVHRLDVAEDCEITLEANPEDVSFEKMRAYALLGINRVSMGIQSLEDNLLKELGRTHSVAKGVDAICATAEAGITNISIDLMYDLPCQTGSNWRSTLDQIKHLPITHLSLYNLTLEPHTAFFKKREHLTPLIPSDEESLALLNEGVFAIEAAGLLRYEISAFAKPGCRSLHNTGYWQGRPFLGFGPSAFSYWEGRRFRNVAHLNRYSQALDNQQFPVDFEECLSPSARVAELLAVRLRLLEGVDLLAFEARHGVCSADLKATLTRLVDEGWLLRAQNRYSLSIKGMLFYDTIASDIIS